MGITELRQQLLDNGSVGPVASWYLDTYIGCSDWPHELKELEKRVVSTRGVDWMRQLVCCAILLPALDQSTFIDPAHPENLLRKIGSGRWQQLADRDWFHEFKTVVTRDIEIAKWRREALNLGIVQPFDCAPMCRQAYNWLYLKAEESGVIINPEAKIDIADSFKNQVYAYGGAIICNIFTRHPQVLKKVVNWRSGYFFERVIHEVYTEEEILKIKGAELAQTNAQLVKTVKFI